MKLVDVENIEFRNMLAQLIYDSQFECGCISLIKYLDSLQPDFDVDSIVSHLEGASRRMVTEKFPHVYYRAVSLKFALSIIRSGGIKRSATTCLPLYSRELDDSLSAAGAVPGER